MADITKFPLTTNSPQIEVTLPVGENVLELVVEDSAGLRSEPDRVVITVEQEAVPEIRDIEPSGGLAGATVAAVIAGENLLGATEVSFSGSGVSADIRPGGTAEELPVRIQIDLRAAEDDRSFTVVTPAGTAESPSGVVFTVEAAAPEIIGIEPSSGQQGTAPEAVIVGRGLTEASRTRFSGEGVGCRVLRSSDRKVEVQVLINSTAPLGERTFQLLGREDIIVDSKDFGITFEVTRGLPTVTSPTVTRPTTTGPTITRPTVTMPTVTRPTVTRPISTVPIITRPIVPPRAPERLAEIRGIGAASKEKLHTAGIRSVKDLALASPERVAEILGIRDINKAKAFIDEAKRLIR